LRLSADWQGMVETEVTVTVEPFENGGPESDGNIQRLANPGLAC